ncbi:MAG: hypothetical protein B7Z78_10675 [Rhodospirillales bacterium 20-60-12]|nr:MAG: hypothetical protein B7Z78_10675 [Rhodospirillales bacterium 20-60-12]
MPKLTKPREPRRAISLDDAGEIVTIAELCAIEAASRATITRRLRAGEYRAFRDGGKTLILVQSIRARRAALAAATYRAA